MLGIIGATGQVGGLTQIFLPISELDAKRLFDWDDDVIALFQDMRLGYTSKISPELEMLLKHSKCW